MRYFVACFCGCALSILTSCVNSTGTIGSEKVPVVRSALKNPCINEIKMRAVYESSVKIKLTFYKLPERISESISIFSLKDDDQLSMYSAVLHRKELAHGIYDRVFFYKTNDKNINVNNFINTFYENASNEYFDLTNRNIASMIDFPKNSNSSSISILQTLDNRVYFEQSANKITYRKKKSTELSIQTNVFRYSPTENRFLKLCNVEYSVTRRQ